MRIAHVFGPIALCMRIVNSGESVKPILQALFRLLVIGQRIFKLNAMEEPS